MGTVVPYLDWDDAYHTKLSQWALSHNPHSLWLWGPTGERKTRSVSEKLRDVPCRWVQWSDAVSTIGEYGQITADWKLLCKAVCPIVIDDFGKTGLTNFVCDGIFHLLDTRLALSSQRKGKYRTYITSMYSPTELGEMIKRVYTKGNAHDMGTAIARRIKDLCCVYPDDNAETRGKRTR